MILTTNEQETLDKLKAKIFYGVIEGEHARKEERQAGIIHNTSCFVQIAPWKVKK